MKITRSELRRLVLEAYRVPDSNPGTAPQERRPELFGVDEPLEMEPPKPPGEESEAARQHREEQEQLKRRARQMFRQVMGDYGDINQE